MSATLFSPALELGPAGEMVDGRELEAQSVHSSPEMTTGRRARIDVDGARGGKRHGHVLRLPREQSEVGGDERDAERREVDPRHAVERPSASTMTARRTT